MTRFYLLFIFTLSLICTPLLVAEAQDMFFPNPHVDNPVPDFTLNTTQRQNVNLHSAIDGKKAIIFFWATWCPHCRTALDNLAAKKEALKADGIEVVLVDVGEDKTKVERHLKSRNMDFEVYLDADSAVSEEFAIIGVPTFLFVGEDGRVRYVGHALSDDILETVFQK